MRKWSPDRKENWLKNMYQHINNSMQEVEEYRNTSRIPLSGFTLIVTYIAMFLKPQFMLEPAKCSKIARYILINYTPICKKRKLEDGVEPNTKKRKKN